jgi:hypothetical protein
VERVYPLQHDLECLPESDGASLVLAEGALVMEPHLIRTDSAGSDWLFLASLDGGQSWQERVTVLAEGEEFPADLVEAKAESY